MENGNVLVKASLVNSNYCSAYRRTFQILRPKYWREIKDGKQKECKVTKNLICISFVIFYNLKTRFDLCFAVNANPLKLGKVIKTSMCSAFQKMNV